MMLEKGSSKGVILIVDDQAYNRDLLSYILEDYGYRCVMAADGQEAVGVMQQDESIELILMDVSMPVMDGFEATRQIKQNMGDRYQPIVFVTAFDNDETLAKCLSVGGDDFIPKPINENVLIAKVEANKRTATLYQQLKSSNDSLRFHQKIMDREHAIIEHVFQNGMKRVDMACRNIHSSITPMSMFNGDLILSAPSCTGGVYVLLGDFTGHGLSAAIGGLPVSDIFYAMTKKHSDVGEIAYEVNLRLQSLLPSYMFFCAAIVEMSADGDRLNYWIGGMNDVLVIGESGGVQQRLCAQHMPLGVLDSSEFESTTASVSIKPGSKLFIYTDGVIEGQNEVGQVFGEERLEAIFAEPERSYVEPVSRALEAFQKAQSDDISFVEINCAPVIFDNPEAVESFIGLSQDRVDLPWEFKVHLESDDLKRGDTVPQIIALVAKGSFLSPYKGTLFTVLSELFNNALEHGILKLNSILRMSAEGFDQYYEERKSGLANLDSGFIDISLKLIGESYDQIEITVTDSGDGFDSSELNQGFYEIEPIPRPCGRGLLIVGAMCDSVSYSNGGRTVSAILSLKG